MLDRRFARYGIQNETAMVQCKKYIEDEVSKSVDIASEPTTLEEVSKCTRAIWDRIDTNYASHKARIQEGTSSSHELRQYFDEDPINRHSDPLAWWSKREILYPRLSLIAKNIFRCAPHLSPAKEFFQLLGSLCQKSEID